MKLHYLANLFATKHYVGSALGLDSSSRRLTLDQAEAAKRVDDAVNVALSSVENGDVTGVALPLNYVALSSAGTQQLTVNLGLPGIDRNLNILIDTGMSYAHIICLTNIPHHFIILYSYRFELVGIL